MLHKHTIKPDTLDTLIRIQALPELSDTRLVGGTALALHLGHRLSIDIDLSFLIERHSLGEILAWYRDKYPQGSEYLVLRSLVYFDDAEDDPMPVMLKPLAWEAAKERIRQAVREVALA